ncbi:type VI secretion system-associated protein TagF [Oxalobacteraceae bacterium A2-2]
MHLAPGAGFFGKVTSHGDFVSRRLAPAFVQPWDGWLQQGLQASKAALGARWLATYMNSPIWHFALAPGVCGHSAWAGLMMPSVDRVGRHFPLTLAAELAAGTSLPDCLTSHAAWHARLEELALSSLAEQFSLDAFDAALSALEAPSLVSAPATVIALDQAQGLEPQLQAAGASGLLRGIAAAALAGQGLWWTDGSPQVAPCVALSRGLPPPSAFAALLDGDWRGHGWPGV